VLQVAIVPEEGTEGATVFIDGEDQGTAYRAGIELSPGPHHVLVRAERYKEFETDVDIGGAGTIQDLTVEMEPRWAAVSFTSEPAGAAVRVEGKTLGETPVTVDLLEGAHGYELELPGYKTYRSELAVVAGEPQSAAARLVLADGTLLLRSVPPGARVTVDGVYRGETPLDIPLAPGDPHDIEVSRAGYESQSHQARFQSGNEQQLIVELVPIFGEVEIVSDPPDAMLYVDGELRGPANQVHRLLAVPQDIEVRKEGRETFRTHITPRQGFPQSIEVSLRSLDEARVEDMPAVIKTAQGAELRLVQPSRFTMGASRREPGRRANETLREVELTRRFYLAIEEVSNLQFREFDPSHRSGAAGRQNLEIDHHPVVRVTWEAAARYCNWLSERESLPAAYVERDGKLVPRFPPSLGYRLPTEAEWTRAARYPDGDPGRKYPWGDSLPVEPSSGNYGDDSAEGMLSTTLPDYNDSYPVTAPTSSFLPNPLGILNLGGNVSEWIHDFYSIYPPGGSAPERDPLGPETGELHVILGSSWMDGNVTDLRLSYRDYGTDARPDVGFRIAKYAE
jgi:formylglycine-generating enzyme required for sulfatase activity